MPKVISRLTFESDELRDFLRVIGCGVARNLARECEENAENPPHNHSDYSLLDQASGIGAYRDFRPFDDGDNRRVSDLVDLGLFNRLRQGCVELLFHRDFAGEAVLLEHQHR